MSIIKRDNADRAHDARAAVLAHQDGSRIVGSHDEQIEALTDLCADIRHLCDELSLDHGVIQERAHAAYLGDLAEAGEDRMTGGIGRIPPALEPNGDES